MLRPVDYQPVTRTCEFPILSIVMKWLEKLLSFFCLAPPSNRNSASNSSHPNQQNAIGSGLFRLKGLRCMSKYFFCAVVIHECRLGPSSRTTSRARPGGTLMSKHNLGSNRRDNGRYHFSGLAIDCEYTYSINFNLTFSLRRRRAADPDSIIAIRYIRRSGAVHSSSVFFSCAASVLARRGDSKSGGNRNSAAEWVKQPSGRHLRLAEVGGQRAESAISLSFRSLSSSG
jgi:hypothetical protein